VTDRPAPRWRVLVADDEASVREFVASVLRSDGRFEIVGEAGHGRDAVRMAALGRPDVVILDLMMPVMGGLHAIPELRRACPTARILVMSAYGSEANWADAEARGADARMAKGGWGWAHELVGAVAELCIREP